MTPASSMPPLDGATTGAAKEIDAQLARIDLPPKAGRFFNHLKVQTFGNAGFHRQWKHEKPGTWTHFDLAAWSEATGLPRSTILRVRDTYTQARMLWYEADSDMPGRGRIGWNLDFQEWKPDCNWGGKRERAGRPKATNLSDLNTSNQTFHLENEDEKLIKTESLLAGKLIKMKSLPARKLFNMESAVASAPDAQTPRERSRIRRKEEDTKEKILRISAASLEAAVAPNGAAFAGEKDEFPLRKKEDSVALVPVAQLSDSPAPEGAPGSRLHESRQEVSPELESLWNLVRSTLRPTIGEAAYENHVAALKVIGTEGNVIYLQANATFTAQHFQQRFADQASGILSTLIHRDAEVRCLPPATSRAALLDEVMVAPAGEPEPEPPEEKLTMKAVVARDLFDIPPGQKWNKSAATSIQKVVNELKSVDADTSTALRAIQKFKRERPTGSVWEFLTKLPKLVAAVGGA